MNPEQLAASYDRLATHWASAEFNRDNGIAQHERALKFVSPSGHALDVGCGSSGRIIDLLEQRGFTVEGVDLSAQMLRLARRRHPHVTFHHADICHWMAPRQYDLISAWDSIWHVPLARQSEVIAKLCGALRQGGVLIFTTGGVEQAEEKHDPCMGQPMYHAAPGIPQVLQILHDAGCACRHLEYDQYPAQHVYLIAQRIGDAANRSEGNPALPGKRYVDDVLGISTSGSDPAIEE